VASLKDKSKPIVICVEYEIDKSKSHKIINLLTSDGHKLLASAHNLFRIKMEIESLDSPLEVENLDSFALELLMSKSPSFKGIIACFQEGQSYQGMIYNHNYENKYVNKQTGFSPGDHVEICFYPDFELENQEISLLNKKDILKDSDEICKIWELTCKGLTDPIESDQEYKEVLLNLLLNK
jgi:hypothetical protein